MSAGEARKPSLTRAIAIAGSLVGLLVSLVSVYQLVQPGTFDAVEMYFGCYLSREDAAALIDVGKRLRDRDIVYADIQTMGWEAGCNLREDADGRIKGETEGDLVINEKFDWIEVRIGPRPSDPAWGRWGWQTGLSIKFPLDASPSSLIARHFARNAILLSGLFTVERPRDNRIAEMTLRARKTTNGRSIGGGRDGWCSSSHCETDGARAGGRRVAHRRWCGLSDTSPDPTRTAPAGRCPSGWRRSG